MRDGRTIIIQEQITVVFIQSLGVLVFHVNTPWTWHNWVWLVLIILVLAVKLNDGFGIREDRKDEYEYVDITVYKCGSNMEIIAEQNKYLTLVQLVNRRLKVDRNVYAEKLVQTKYVCVKNRGKVMQMVNERVVEWGNVWYTLPRARYYANICIFSFGVWSNNNLLLYWFWTARGIR